MIRLPKRHPAKSGSADSGHASRQIAAGPTALTVGARPESFALQGENQNMTPEPDTRRGGAAARAQATLAQRGPWRMAWLLALAACCLAATVPHAHAGVVAERVKSRHQVRVCIWPDYYGITYRDPRTQQLRGIDIDLSAALGADLGVKVAYVDSSFATLIDDVRGDRCDVAMFAVGVLPQRQAVLRFSQPYLQSDIYGITMRASRIVRSWADIDKPGVNVAVQAGTFMEPVMRASLKQANLVVLAPPQTREQELQAGRVDVFMTDYPYSRRLLDNADWARLVSPSQPFHRIPYAYAMRQDDEEWYRTINAFVERIKHDGRLEQAARRHGLTEVLIRQ